MKITLLTTIITLIVLTVGCKKSSSENEKNYKIDSLERIWTIISKGGGIINEALETAKSNSSLPDYHLIATMVKKIDGVSDAKYSGTGIDLLCKDGSTFSLLISDATDKRFFVPNNSYNFQLPPSIRYVPSPAIMPTEPPYSFSSSTSTPSSRKAIILAPFQYELDGNLVKLQHLLEQAGYEVQMCPNEYARLEYFTGDYLSQFGVIYITTHGIGKDKGNNSQILTGTPINKNIFMGLTATQQKDMRYGNTPRQQTTYFAITENYLKNTLTKKFPNSLVFFNGCETAQQDNFANFFLQNGAMAYCGNVTLTDSVLLNANALEFFAYLITGYDIEQAYKFIRYQKGLFGALIPINSSVNSFVYKKREGLPFTLVEDNKFYCNVNPAFGLDGSLVNIQMFSDYETDKRVKTVEIYNGFTDGKYIYHTSDLVGNKLIYYDYAYDKIDLKMLPVYPYFPHAIIYSYTYYDVNHKIIGRAAVPFTVVN